MAMIGPPSWALRRKNLQPPPRSDRRVSPWQWLLVAGAVLLVIAVGVLAWRVSRLAVPTLVNWQITVVDETSDAPPLPDLPADPFTR
ncbi:hypothetical protein [Micromonospora sp. NPDC005979]|uniref:hypothetical protein n=1 Tax=Micromonospora sp. NPDC005979 TaxID=3156726 RepID=UPI0033ABC545